MTWAGVMTIKIPKKTTTTTSRALELITSLEQFRRKNGSVGENAEVSEISHYTDLNALRLIIQKGELWASNILFLNDSREMSYGTDEAVKILRQNAESSKDKRKIFQSVQTNIEREGIPDAFACCFCEKPDHLGQWRGYGTGAQNISIQFDRIALETHFSEVAVVRKVIYGQSRARKELASQIKQAFAGGAFSNDLFADQELLAKEAIQIS